MVQLLGALFIPPSCWSVNWYLGKPEASPVSQSKGYISSTKGSRDNETEMSIKAAQSFIHIYLTYAPNFTFTLREDESTSNFFHIIQCFVQVPDVINLCFSFTCAFFFFFYVIYMFDVRSKCKHVAYLYNIFSPPYQQNIIVCDLLL